MHRQLQPPAVQLSLQNILNSSHRQKRQMHPPTAKTWFLDSRSKNKRPLLVTSNQIKTIEARNQLIPVVSIIAKQM